MTDAGTDAEGRLLASSRVFFLIALLKVFAVASTLQMLTSPDRSAVPIPPLQLQLGLVAYLISLGAAVAIGIGLRRRSRLARTAGFVYGGIQLFGFVLAFRLGVLFALTGILGLIAIVTLAVASGLGAFETSGDTGST
jgi:hypothetical protein